MRRAALAAALQLVLFAGPLTARAAEPGSGAPGGGAVEAERRRLEQILSRREFTAARRESGLELQTPELETPSFLKWLSQKIGDLAKRFFDWLEELTRRNRPPRVETGSWVGAGSGPLTWALAAAAAVLLVLALRGAWRRRRPAGGPVEGVAVGDLAAPAQPDALSQPADVWARFAEQFARDGEWRLALRALYLELLVVLHERGAIRYERQRTNGDYARALRPTPAGAPFGRLTAAFDLAWYGNKDCQAADYQTALQWTREVDRLSAPREPGEPA